MADDSSDMDDIAHKMKKKTFCLPILRSVEEIQEKIGDGVPMEYVSGLISDLLWKLPEFHRRRYIYMTRCYDSKQEWKTEFASFYEELVKDKDLYNRYMVKRVFLVSFTYFIGKFFNQILLRRIHKIIFKDGDMKTPFTRRELLYHYYDKVSPSLWFKNNYIFAMICHVLDIPFSFTEDHENIQNYRKESAVLKIILKGFENRLFQLGGGPLYDNLLYEAITKKKCTKARNVKIKWIQKSFKKSKGDEMINFFYYTTISRFEKDNPMIGIKRSFSDIENNISNNNNENNNNNNNFHISSPSPPLPIIKMKKKKKKKKREEFINPTILNHQFNSYFGMKDEKNSSLNQKRNEGLSIVKEIKARHVPYHLILEIIQFQTRGYIDFTFKISKIGILHSNSSDRRLRNENILVSGIQNSTKMNHQEDAMKIWFGRVGSSGGFQRIVLVFPFAYVRYECSNSSFFLNLPKDLRNLKLEGPLNDFFLSSSSFPNIENQIPVFLHRVSFCEPQSRLDEEKIIKILTQNRIKLDEIEFCFPKFYNPDLLFDVIRENFSGNYTKLSILMSEGTHFPIKDLHNLFSKPFPIQCFYLKNQSIPPISYHLKMMKTGPYFLSNLTYLSLVGCNFDEEKEFLGILKRKSFCKLKGIDLSEGGFGFGFIINVLNALGSHLQEFKCNGCLFEGDVGVQREGNPFLVMERPLDIYPTLYENKILKKIEMEGCTMTKTRIDFLSRSLKSLNHLSFYRFGLTRTIRMLDFLFFLDGLKSVKLSVQNPQMVKVVVENSKCLEEVYVHFLRGKVVDALNYVTRNCSENLKIVTLEKERFFLDRQKMDRVESKEVQKVYLKFTNIQSILLWNASVDPQLIRTLLSTCPNLKEVRVKGSLT